MLLTTSVSEAGIFPKFPKPTIWWHGSVSGDLRGGTSGLHLGTHNAATQALEARIGIRADGKPWTGDQEYGKTLLAGKKTLHQLDPSTYRHTGINSNAPEHDYYPTPGHLKYPDGSHVPMNTRPSVSPYRLRGEMTNTPGTAHPDFKANGYMKAAIKRGTPKKGYYYRNEGEDGGSISIVVPPGGSHLVPHHEEDKKEAVTAGGVAGTMQSNLGLTPYNATPARGDRSPQWLGRDEGRACMINGKQGVMRNGTCVIQEHLIHEEEGEGGEGEETSEDRDVFSIHHLLKSKGFQPKQEDQNTTSYTHGDHTYVRSKNPNGTNSWAHHFQGNPLTDLRGRSDIAIKSYITITITRTVRRF